MNCIKTLRDAMQGGETTYADLVCAVLEVVPDHSAEVDEVLLDLQNFEGEFNIKEGTECPHSKTVEEMMKSIVMQIFNKRVIGVI